jgi:probable rRNA maturation factor
MNQYIIEIEIDQGISCTDTNQLEFAAKTTLAYFQFQEMASVTILLTSDDRLRKLNSQFLGYDESTDVLSFPAGEAMPGAKKDNYLGDIAISMPAAKRQAAAGGHGLDDELKLLVIHALLHLMGYDHANREEKKEMWALQDQLLTLIGVKIDAYAASQNTD